MKKQCYIYFTVILFFATSLFAEELTVASYNCGGLSDHYDYLRSACIKNIIQSRYIQEPDVMTNIDCWQKNALSSNFSNHNPQEYHFDALLCVRWNEQLSKTISDWRVRPVKIYDQQVYESLYSHIKDVLQGQGLQVESCDLSLNEMLDILRDVMTRRIFKEDMCHDLICLQETDYLEKSQFPKDMSVHFCFNNGVAWNQKRFEFLRDLGDIEKRSCSLLLLDRETNKTVLVVSGHLTGCHPMLGQDDSRKGDQELTKILEHMDAISADIKILAMDSNVTPSHPRLLQLKDHHFLLDDQNHLYPTCTNPMLVVDTRIDWIAVKSSDQGVKIVNVPVNGVHLNCMRTNISDHRPVASKITY